jgi:two-component system chemotaxis response regulator CheY
MTGESKLSVLIVDDDDVSRSMLRFILGSAQRYHVLGEADSGAAGLEMTARLLPDVVCLDLNMPDLGGLEILKLIKAQWPRTMVMMVTASADRTSVLNAVRSGADGYIVKPFDPATLLLRMEQAIKK